MPHDIVQKISPTLDDLSCWPMNQILKFLAHSVFAFSFSLKGHFDNWRFWNCSRPASDLLLRRYLAMNTKITQTVKTLYHRLKDTLSSANLTQKRATAFS